MAPLTACSWDSIVFTHPQKEVECVVLCLIDEERVSEIL